MAGAAGLAIAVVGLVSSNKSAKETKVANDNNLQAQYESSYNQATANLATAQAAHAAAGAYASDLRKVAGDQRKVAADIAASGEEAYDLAMINAGMIREEGAEETRRKELDNDQVESLTLARQGASGVKIDSKSYELYYDAQVDANAQVVEWMNKATESQALLEQERGEYEKTLANISSKQALANADMTDAQAGNALAMAEVGVIGAQAAFAGLIAPEQYVEEKKKKTTTSFDGNIYRGDGGGGK